MQKLGTSTMTNAYEVNSNNGVINIPLSGPVKGCRFSKVFRVLKIMNRIS